MPKYLSLKQLADFLGVSDRHLYRLKAAELLPPPIRIGRCNRWDPDEVVKHLADEKNGKAGRKRRRQP
jgi:predicted DNA-binding transcriptional regulator AlpA